MSRDRTSGFGSIVTPERMMKAAPIYGDVVAACARATGTGSTGRRLPGLMLLLALCPGFIMEDASATTFDIPIGDESIEAVSNTTLIGGVAVRTEDRDSRLIGKGHLDPDVCGRDAEGRLYYQSCQGLFRTQTFTAERLANAPGFANGNLDQGNLNYDKGDITQSGLRLNQDLTLTWGNFGFFVKGFAFWDPVNDDFTENHPNMITRQNYQQVGYVSTPGSELIRLGNVSQALSILAPIIGGLGLSDNIVGQLLSNPTAIPVLGVRNDSTPCPADRNPGSQPCGLVYGRGGQVYSKRTDSETLSQIGKDIVLQDINFYGSFGLPWDAELLFKIGRQQVNWGESTLEFFDSLNVANPPDFNNLFRLGGNGLDDFYTPVNMISLSTSLFEGASISGYYQLEWRPLGTPAPGGYYSSINLGTNDAGADYLTNGFGQFADDPDKVGTLLDNPLSGITNTTANIPRLPDREPGYSGQFGVQFKYYAEWLNDGTDIGVYFANYHSRTPMVSFLSADEGCAKSATNTLAFLLACADMPLLHGIYNPNDPAGATSDVVALDSARFFLEYPKNIQMYGLSFNTTLGEVALQGEVAYRPHDPLQVAIVDLAFAAYGPTFTNCDQGCPLGLGELPGIGTLPDGGVGFYPGSRFVVDGNGTPGAFNDVIYAIVGDVPSSARAFPSFVIPYRGGQVGHNPANSYIRGWEEFETYSFNLGATYVEGTTDLVPRLLGADQIIWLLELGARWVPGLPSLDRLQLEAPGLEYHASAGADGSGADGSQQACSTNPACSYGADGTRFNPHQQDRDLYPDQLSGGYALVAQIRYESVLPAISLSPQIIFKHDVYGTSPGLASNFIEGRIYWDTGLEIRYRSQLSLNLGYQFFAGGGVANQLHDRDNARAFIKYAF